MPAVLRWALGLVIAVSIVAVPWAHHRSVYAHSKRLRVVAPGKLYRCGQLTEAGFADAIARYRIRTVLNVQNEFPDPPIRQGEAVGHESIDSLIFDPPRVRESELCATLGVQYHWLSPELIDRRRVPAERPRAIDDFLKLMDDPANHPVLLHCKAGLHRTGLLAAIYRMEYDGWSKQAAVRELKANGFGEFACTTANDYLVQYIQAYQPRQKRGQGSGLRTQDSGVRKAQPLLTPDP
jgi:tyrosine-protein phosphatase SIW14